MRDLKGYIVIDLETTIQVYMKRKASPFTLENWIVAGGYKALGTTGPKAGEVVGDYFGNNSQASRGWLKSLLEKHNPKYLVGFNFKFDLQWMLRFEEDYEAYMQWIVDGGELWDTQIVEYLLDNMVEDSHMLSLDEVSIRYGGEVKIDEVKAYWAKGISTEFIPKQLLLDYLIGRKEEDGSIRPGDIQNTEMIFRGQVEASRKRKNLQAIRLNNGALVATTEMERNGLYVDMQIAEIEMERLAKEIAAAEEKLRDFYPRDMPIEMNWNSVVHKSAIFFGGSIPYTQKVPMLDPADGRQMFVQKEETHYLMSDGTTMEVGLFDELAASGDTVVIPILNKSGKLAGQPKTKKVKVDDLTKPKFRNEEFHVRLPGYVKPKPSWKSKAYDNVYSTSKEVIEDIADSGLDIPFVEHFVSLSKMQKDLSTYYRVEVYEDGEDEEGNPIKVLKKSTGMLTLVQPDSIVHHNIQQTSTVTGRFSHTAPNSGNLPREGTSRVKQMFTSRFKNGKIISSDFRSLEVYAQAVLTGDKQLIADLLADIDMHVMRLSVVEGKPYEELLVLAKGDKKKGIKSVLEWERKRTDIKRFSFQRAYGAGAKKIAGMVKRDVETVEGWIVADDKRYSGIPLWNERVANQVAKHSVASKTTIVHPTAKIPLHLHRGTYTTFDGTTYSWLESASPDFLVKKGIYQSFKPTEMKNYPVQGLGAQWMKAAMWIAVRMFYFYRNFGGKGLLNNTVHDAVYADADESVARKVGIVVHASMLEASTLMEYLFEKEIKVPVPSETTVGPSQFDQDDFEDQPAFNAGVEKVRQFIRKEWMDDYEPLAA